MGNERYIHRMHAGCCGLDPLEWETLMQGMQIGMTDSPEFTFGDRLMILQGKNFMGLIPHEQWLLNPGVDLFFGPFGSMCDMCDIKYNYVSSKRHAESMEIPGS